jgi:hypothetical protein
MPYKGHVRNGVIVLDEPAQLEDGAEVHIELASRVEEKQGHRPFRERYAAVIGKADGLPRDAAENIEHYLYGAPKK